MNRCILHNKIERDGHAERVVSIGKFDSLTKNIEIIAISNRCIRGLVGMQVLSKIRWQFLKNLRPKYESI